MANRDWCGVNAGWPNVRHVRHGKDPSNCRMAFWHKRNIPKRHQQPPHTYQRHTGKPPTLLRLDSAGESVEEYPHITHGPVPGGRSGRRNNPGGNNTPTNSLLSNIWSKVGYPLQSHGSSHLVKTKTSPQSDINLDRLVEKFNSSCEMEQKLRTHAQMASQTHSPLEPMQPAKQVVPVAVPPVTFNGGPYVTWTSQDNGPRTFPAYYRFLNFSNVHFHPYNNAVQMNRPHAGYGPPLSQSKHAWGNLIQSPQHSYRKQCNQTKASHPTFHGRKSNHLHVREFKQFCGGNTKNNDGMMQNKQAMSHQQGPQNSSTSTTSAHGVNRADHANKGHMRGFDKCRPQEAKTGSTCTVKNEKSSNSCNNSTLHKDSCHQSKGQPCEMPCATQSENLSTKSCSNSDPDKVPAYQEGHACKCIKTQADHLSETVCESKCRLTGISKQLCSQTNERNVCNTRSKTSDACTKPQPEKLPAKNATDTTSGTNKEMHSSIAYLLGDYKDNPDAVCSNDSDFSDGEDVEPWDEVDDACELLKSFQSDDPYNPMYGWKYLTNGISNTCSSTNRLSTQEAENASNNRDSSVALNDSGVSTVEQSPDEVTSSESSTEDTEDSEYSFTSSSDEWSDSGCDDEEEQKIWNSLSRCTDPYDPMGGWRIKPNLASAASKSTDVQDFDNVPNPSHKMISPLKSNLQPLPLHEIPCNKSSKKHSSVSFILGADDDSECDSPDNNNIEESNDESDTLDLSGKYEDLWESFQSSSDPYNPINGWKCRSPSSLHRSASSPSELCQADREAQRELTPLKTLPSTDDPPEHGQKSIGSVSLIQSSSTGCMKTVWEKAIQCDKERKAKKVSFCTEEPVIISPEVPMWEDEYIEARRGRWEEVARDRCRFQRRVRQAELNIAPCFTPGHRVKIYQKLYL